MIPNISLKKWNNLQSINRGGFFMEIHSSYRRVKTFRDPVFLFMKEECILVRDLSSDSEFRELFRISGDTISNTGLAVDPEKELVYFPDLESSIWSVDSNGNASRIADVKALEPALRNPRITFHFSYAPDTRDLYFQLTENRHSIAEIRELNRPGILDWIRLGIAYFTGGVVLRRLTNGVENEYLCRYNLCSGELVKRKTGYARSIVVNHKDGLVYWIDCDPDRNEEWFVRESSFSENPGRRITIKNRYDCCCLSPNGERLLLYNYSSSTMALVDVSDESELPLELEGVCPVWLNGDEIAFVSGDNRLLRHNLNSARTEELFHVPGDSGSARFDNWGGTYAQAPILSSDNRYFAWCWTVSDAQKKLRHGTLVVDMIEGEYIPIQEYCRYAALMPQR